MKQRHTIHSKPTTNVKYICPHLNRKVMTIIANILVQRFNKITLLNLWRNTPNKTNKQKSQPYQVEKVNVINQTHHKTIGLNRDTLILQSSQIRETKIGK